MGSKKQKSVGPKIVYLDLETLPNLPEALKLWCELSAFPFRTMKADVTSIICFGYMTSDMKKPKVISAWDFPDVWKKDVNDDYLILKKAVDILYDADVIVTHNGKRFDLPFLNTRIMLMREKYKDKNLIPLPPIIHEDTCNIAKKKMFLFSNRLNRLSEVLGSKQKIDTGGWDLWVKVWHKNKTAQRFMAKYCAQDIVATKSNYDKIQILSKDFPHMKLFGETTGAICPRCGSNKLQSRGSYTNKTKRVERFSCKVCKKWSAFNKKLGSKSI